MRQEQFLDVVDEAVARDRWEAATHGISTGIETVPLADAFGRVIAEEVRARTAPPSDDAG